MAEHAKTYYQQALTALEGGEPARAMDLLRRAKIMAGDDPRLMASILTEMIRTAPQVGCLGEAVTWDRQLSQIQARLQPPVRPPAAEKAAWAPKRKWPAWKWTAAGLPTAAAVIVAGVFLWNWSAARYADYDSSSGASFSGGRSSKKKAPHWSDNVGLVLWLQRYQGSNSAGADIAVEFVLSTGSAFAVTDSGTMLTNKHVTEMDSNSVPKRLDLSKFLGAKYRPFTRSGEPYLMVCFGPESQDHYPGEVVYESQLYDVAVLKVDREFDDPLDLSFGEVKMTSQVMTCGFPGAVRKMTTSGNRAHINTRMKDALLRTKSVTFTDYLPPDVFSPISTTGIISAADREMEGPLYHMIDATVGPGNSGGPLLDVEDEEVIGIVTLAATGQEEYNFALALPQLRSELNRFLR